MLNILKSASTKSMALFGLFILILASKTTAQSLIKGKIVFDNSSKPAALASVKLLRRDLGTIADASGNFSLAVEHLKPSDTLQISFTGYEDLKVPAQKAVQLSEFELHVFQKTLAAVVVKSFRNEETTGSKAELIGYQRGWESNNRGGEIGQSFLTKHKEYQVGKVRFKMYSTYDTCIVRLHIRDIKNGLPDRELLKDNVTLTITMSPPQENVYEFDLEKYNLVVSTQNIFISFEVLKCISTDNTIRSISFVGSEEGKYYYKSDADDYWHSSEAYRIFISLFVRYNN